MRYTIILLLSLPILASGQSAYVRHYKQATAVDTVFTDTSGLVKVSDTLMTINHVQYAALRGADYTDPMTNEIFTPYTLANGWSCLVRRFSNLELMSVTVDEGTEQDCYYTR